MDALGLINTWHETKIMGGDSWQDVIDENFRRADLILLLIRRNFFAYDWQSAPSVASRLYRRTACPSKVGPTGATETTLS